MNKYLSLILILAPSVADASLYTFEWKAEHSTTPLATISAEIFGTIDTTTDILTILEWTNHFEQPDPHLWIPQLPAQMIAVRPHQISFDEYWNSDQPNNLLALPDGAFVDVPDDWNGVMDGWGWLLLGDYPIPMEHIRPGLNATKSFGGGVPSPSVGDGSPTLKHWPYWVWSDIINEERYRYSSRSLTVTADRFTIPEIPYSYPAAEDSPIPEPAAWLVWAVLGLTVGGVYRWRRRA